MKTDDKKAAIAAYKERKPVAGIFLVRGQTSDQLWIGHSPDLDKAQNRIWFTLRMGSHRNPVLQKAWRDHGAEGFTFEVVERLEDEIPAWGLAALLKERAAHWRSTLDAALL